jgi:hypothetical protein
MAWLRSMTPLELGEYVSIFNRLHAVKGETPTQQITPSVYKRRLTHDQCGLESKNV